MDLDEPLHPDEPWAQVRLCLTWLGVSWIAMFSSSSVASMFGLFLGPLLMVVVVLAAWAFFLVVAFKLLKAFYRPNVAILVVSLFAYGVTLPQAWYCDSNAHALVALVTSGIWREADAQALLPPPQRDAVIYIEYFPGFLAGSQSTGVVYDPLDRPARRVNEFFGYPGYAACRHLVAHYYNCTA